MIDVTSRETGRGTVEVTVRGDLDAVTAAGLRHVLDGIGPVRLELDLTGVGFCDCAGARLLLRTGERLRAHGGALVVLRPSAPVLRLLGLLGLDRHLPVGGAVGASRTGGGD
ncbi:STAS domain-containing protein [Planomonospora corallina]|uniref:Anti-sigma factor antagonist n=1 Tax=Planomonospora corallina TaxID=1806052 RepID=A0ABV8IEQ3_9ACTN